MNARSMLSGIATYLPGATRVRATGGTDSARYCYSVWLRHLATNDVLLQEPRQLHRARVPAGDATVEIEQEVKEEADNRARKIIADIEEQASGGLRWTRPPSTSPCVMCQPMLWSRMRSDTWHGSGPSSRIANCIGTLTNAETSRLARLWSTFLPAR